MEKIRKAKIATIFLISRSHISPASSGLHVAAVCHYIPAKNFIDSFKKLMFRPCRKQVRLTGRKEHLAGGGVTTLETDQLCDITKGANSGLFWHLLLKKRRNQNKQRMSFFTSHKQGQILKCFGRIWDLNSNPPLAD